MTRFLSAFVLLVAFAQTVPNDPQYSSQWYLPKIGAPDAWAIQTGSPAIVIAILDTGVDGSHEDLAAKMVPGWNVVDGNADTHDVNSHGTMVAGTAAAIGNNGIGVASPAWNCKIMPLRIAGADGYSSTIEIASALVWAADHGAKIANISFAASNYFTTGSAAEYFQSKGGVVVMSAGNEGTVDNTSDNPFVLTISASSNIDTIATWSNTGQNIDIAAPGTMCLTTANGGGYQWFSGTSASAPVVAGVAALVLSTNPSLTPQQVTEIIKRSADDLGPTGWDPAYGYGRVNASRAVAMAAGAATPTPTATLAPSPTPQPTATVLPVPVPTRTPHKPPKPPRPHR